VIAIIGILSALIIIGMSSSTDKATIAKAQVFSNSLKNSIMSDLTSEWRLDDTTGTSAVDSWGGGNNGLLQNFSDTNQGVGDSTNSGWMSQSNCISKTCLKFDLDDRIFIGDNVLAIGDKSFTWEFWGKTTTDDATEHTVFRKRTTVPITNWVGNFNFPNGTTDKALIYLKNSLYRYSATNINNGKWHHVVGVCDKNKAAAPDIYLDGKIDNGAAATADGTCATLENISGGSLYLGINSVAILDELRAYNAAIPTSQIQQNYYVGLNKLYAKQNIDNAEYQQRLADLTSSYAKD